MVRPVGRPRTTVDDLPKDWRDIVASVAQEGGSDVEARVLLGISATAWYTLLEDSQEFKETIKDAKAVCETWWERTGRELAVKGGGNATIWIFNMKNRFGWRDTPKEDDSEAGTPLNISFEVNDPVRSINVTKGAKKA